MKPKFDVIKTTISVEPDIWANIEYKIKELIQLERETKYRKIKRVFKVETHEQVLELLPIQEESVLNKIRSFHPDLEIIESNRSIYNKRLYKEIKMNCGILFISALHKTLTLRYE